MTSINTNASATTALRTLQATNNSLDTTQNRISTGLKIGEAKDNAAYWSISTALRSDTKSLATVKDALNLGAATVDTAYQGLNKTVEVLDEIKSKLTAASQDGVDRKAIQEEIAQLQKQLVSIANASTFSNENWLSVNSGVSSYNATKQVVSGVSSDAAGNFTISTIDVDTSSFALTDANANNEAILDAGKSGNALMGGLAAGTAVVGTSVAASSTQAAIYSYAAGSIPATETLALTFTIDQATVNFTLTDSANFDSIGDLVASLNTSFAGRATASNNSGKLVVTSNTSGANSVVNLTAATFGQTGTAATTSGLVTAGQVLVTGDADAATVVQSSNFGSAVITLDDNDTIDIQLELNGAASKTITVSKDTVFKALGATDGSIADATEYAAVLNQAFEDAGVTDIVASVNGSAIELTSTVLGSTSSIRMSSVEASKGTSVLNIDVTTASKVDLARFLNVVNKASEQVTAAAATLGSVASRVDLQSTFVNTLIDTIDKGISDLIDADLSEESTRLQALQTKQQLGIQALSIANASQQNILRLFQ